MKKEYRIAATITRGRVSYDAETFECSYAKRCIDCDHLLSVKRTADGVDIRCVVGIDEIRDTLPPDELVRF